MIKLLFLKYLNGTMVAKIQILFFLGWLFAFPIKFIEKFLFNDWDFIGILAAFFIMENITGLIVDVKFKRFVPKKYFQDALLELFLTAGCLIIVHGLSNYATGKGSFIEYLIPHFDSVALGGILSYFALNFLVSCKKLGFNILPKWVATKLTDFNENGIYIPLQEQKENKEVA